MMNGHLDNDDDDDVCHLNEVSSDEEHLPDVDGDSDSDDYIDLPDVDGDGDSDDDIEGIDDSLHTFAGHTGELYSVVCSPTVATLVATGGGDDRGFIWKIGEVSHFELQGHTDSVSTLSFSADGQLLASGDLHGLVQVWDASLGGLRHVLHGPGDGIEWIKWHPRGHLLLTGSSDSTVWLWNADREACLHVLSGHVKAVTCGDFTPDGKTIVTGSDDSSLRIWNPRSGECIRVIRGHPYHTGKLTCLSITSDSTLAITGSDDCSVHIVNISTGQVVASILEHSESVECIGLSASYPWVATGSMDNKLLIWDMQYSSARCTCYHDEGVTCLSWLGTSQYIATGCGDGRIRIWDGLSGNCVRTFSGHAGSITSLAISSDGRFLVSVSIDTTARVFGIAEFFR